MSTKTTPETLAEKGFQQQDGKWPKTVWASSKPERIPLPAAESRFDVRDHDDRIL